MIGGYVTDGAGLRFSGSPAGTLAGLVIRPGTIEPGWDHGHPTVVKLWVGALWASPGCRQQTASRISTRGWRMNAPTSGSRVGPVQASNLVRSVVRRQLAHEPLPRCLTRDRDRRRLRELRVGSIAGPGHDAGRHHGGLSSRPVAPSVAPTSPRRVSRLEAFAALSDDPVPDAKVAAKFQAALDGMAGGGGIAATVMTRRWNVERGRRHGGRRARPPDRQPVRHRQRHQVDHRGTGDAARGGGRGLARRTRHRRTSLLTSPSTPTERRSASS